MRFHGGDPDGVEVTDVTCQVSGMTFGGQRAPATSVMFVSTIHHPHQVDGLPEPLPICWVHEARDRAEPGDSEVELWSISFDHGAVPRWCAAGEGDPVTCQQCRELIHA